MNKFAITFLAALAVAATVEAAPRHREPARKPHREPPRRHHYHRPAKKAPSWGWGLNLSPGGLSVGIGTRVGRNGVIGVSLPLVKPEPVVKETVIVQQPVVQQPIVVQQPVVIQQPVQQSTVTYSVTETLPSTRVWVEGHWKIVRDAYGNTVSKSWIPGHWE